MIEQDIPCLDVAVHETMRMHVVQCQQQLERNTFLFDGSRQQAVVESGAEVGAEQWRDNINVVPCPILCWHVNVQQMYDVAVFQMMQQAHFA